MDEEPQRGEHQQCDTMEIDLGMRSRVKNSPLKHTIGIAVPSDLNYALGYPFVSRGVQCLRVNKTAPCDWLPVRSENRCQPISNSI